MKRFQKIQWKNNIALIAVSVNAMRLIPNKRDAMKQSSINAKYAEPYITGITDEPFNLQKKMRGLQHTNGVSDTRCSSTSQALQAMPQGTQEDSEQGMVTQSHADWNISKNSMHLQDNNIQSKKGHGVLAIMGHTLTEDQWKITNYYSEMFWRATKYDATDQSLLWDDPQFQKMLQQVKLAEMVENVVKGINDGCSAITFTDPYFAAIIRDLLEKLWRKSFE